jgi:predicted Zn-dependent protease
MSSSLDIELDAQISNLELEWRQAYDASIVARAEYQALASNPSSGVEMLDMARERLERTESRKARVLVRIERLEDNMLGQG